MNNLNKLLIMISVSLCLFMTVSCVCASEINNINTTNSINNTNSNLLDNVAVPIGTFNELNKDFEKLQENDIYIIQKDFLFNETDKSNPEIKITADNVTIYGKNHIIDACRCDLAKFTVTGKHVTLYDVHFTNFYQTNNKSITCDINNKSSICWIGDNGNINNCTFDNNTAPNGGALTWSGNTGTVSNCTFSKCAADIGGALNWIGNTGTVSNCTFSKCAADIGGAISWSGNTGVIYSSTFDKNTAGNGGALQWKSDDGLISYCVFMNNEARGIGGAIYIGGTNNNISNSIFVNCTSQLSGEAIYLNRNRVNISLKNNGYDAKILYIDGSKSKIDVDAILDYSHYSQVADEKVNLVPLIYSTITKGTLSYLDNGIMYYSEYNNGIFTLHVTKFFDDLSFTKNYKFNGTDNNNIFNDLRDMKYETSITLVNTITITSNVRINTDYTAAITTKPTCFKLLVDYLATIPEAQEDAALIMKKLFNIQQNNRFDNDKISFGLNINFGGAYTVRGDYVMNMNTIGFDIININGNGTKIYIESGDHDENKWAIVGANKVLSVSNIIIDGYNTAIENLNTAGYCILNGVTLNNNHMDYWLDRDYGAGIISTQYVECNNCVFSNNYAKYGGAIYNQGILHLNNCKFQNNHGYGDGDNVCQGCGGYVIVDGKDVWQKTSIVTRCNKDIYENTLMDYINNAFPILKKTNEYSENPSNDIDRILPDIFKKHVESLSVMKNLP